MEKLHCPLVGCFCTIQAASALRLPSFAPIPPLPCCKSSPGTCFAGTSRSPLKKLALILASAPSGTGVRLLLLGPPLVCWGCSAWWSSWHTLCTRITYRLGKQPGIAKLNPPLSMPWLLFVAICWPTVIPQPHLLLWVLSIRLKTSLTLSSNLPLILP